MCECTDLYVSVHARAHIYHRLVHSLWSSSSSSSFYRIAWVLEKVRHNRNFIFYAHFTIIDRYTPTKFPSHLRSYHRNEQWKSTVCNDVRCHHHRMMTANSTQYTRRAAKRCLSLSTYVLFFFLLEVKQTEKIVYLVNMMGKPG